jgi:peptide/nickel transport system ATP-binding protein
LAFEPCGWESRDLRELLEVRWAHVAGRQGVEEEQALFGDLGVLEVPSSEVRFPPPRGGRPEKIVAALERIRSEEPGEPFWQGVERLEGSDTHLEVDFHPPEEPRLEQVGEVDVACHLYRSTR